MGMVLGSSDSQRRFDDPAALLGDRVAPGSLFRFSSDEGGRLFGDGECADLSRASPEDRPTVRPGPRHRHGAAGLRGLSDREACDGLGADLR